ncbi:MAG: TlpA family protein disulfide reductase [Mangrovibacterium sp.]
MKKLINLSLALCLLFAAASCSKTDSNNNFATVNGKWERKGDKVSFFKIVDGRLEELANSVVQDGGQFGFAVPINKEDFYVIGTPESKFQVTRYAFYFKPGDVLSVSVNDSCYALVGDNTVENQEVEKWHKEFIYPLESAFYMDKKTKRSTTYRHFFPVVEEVSNKLASFQPLKTKNELFNARFAEYRQVEMIYNMVMFNFMPRTNHPKFEDYPQAYHAINTDELTSDARILRFPFGASMLQQTLFLAKGLKGEQYQNLDYLTMLKNDTLIGELVVHELARVKSYAVFKEELENNQKYILTDDQKARVEKEKARLGTGSVEGDLAVDFKYPDINGKMVSLSEQRGKVVLIDVWATWCKPCNNEIPHLAKLEEYYHGKNIVFMGVSLDEEKNFQKWKDFVKEEKLGGIQLFANGFKSDIATYYGIHAIPRFILIDQEGKVVSIDAPRPSNPELKKYIDKLLNK